MKIDLLFILIKLIKRKHRIEELELYEYAFLLDKYADTEKRFERKGDC